MVLAGSLIAISTFIGWRRPNKYKQQPYECGITPTGDAREPFSVKFYLVAMVFILFDIEAIFLYPWAVVYRDLNRTAKLFGFVEMFLFVVLVLAGFFYIWKKGVLDWAAETEDVVKPLPPSSIEAALEMRPEAETTTR